MDKGKYCKRCGCMCGDQVFCSKDCAEQWMKENKDLVDIILRDYKVEVKEAIDKTTNILMSIDSYTCPCGCKTEFSAEDGILPTLFAKELLKALGMKK